MSRERKDDGFQGNHLRDGQEGTGHPTFDLHEASRLLRRVLVLNDKVEFHARQRLDTSGTDLQAMQILMAQGDLTSTQLAEHLHLSAAATTTVVDRLVRRGHAERVPHPEDRRRTLIRSVPAAADRVMTVLQPMIVDSDEVVRRMDPHGQEAVLGYLTGIIAAMEKFAADPDPSQASDHSADD